MNIIETSLPRILLFEPRVLGDERGFVVESFRNRRKSDRKGRPTGSSWAIAGRINKGRSSWRSNST